MEELEELEELEWRGGTCATKTMLSSRQNMSSIAMVGKKYSACADREGSAGAGRWRQRRRRGGQMAGTIAIAASGLREQAMLGGGREETTGCAHHLPALQPVQ